MGQSTADVPYMVFEIFKRSYPDQVDCFFYSEERKDWVIAVNGTALYWEGGRLLPESELGSRLSYRPHRFYRYPEELKPIPSYTPEEEQRLLERIRRGERVDTPTESDAFRIALFGASSQRAMDAQIVRIPFLRFSLNMHPITVEPLRRVEEKIQELEKENPEVRRFLEKIHSISTYNWRKIQYFNKLSNHSFGVALDFLPGDWEGKAVYWKWSRDITETWYKIPHSERWSPPEVLISAFESEGFLWGGKWFFFDNMHFEYRPELFLLRKFYFKP